jgi:hypothetical protein
MTDTNSDILFSFNKPTLENVKKHQHSNAIDDLKIQIMQKTNELKKMEEEKPWGTDDINLIVQVLHKYQRIVKTAREHMILVIFQINPDVSAYLQTLHIKLESYEQETSNWIVYHSDDKHKQIIFDTYQGLSQEFTDKVQQYCRGTPIEVLYDMDFFNNFINFHNTNVSKDLNTFKNIMNDISHMEKQLCIERIKNFVHIRDKEYENTQITVVTKPYNKPIIAVQHYVISEDIEGLRTDIKKESKNQEYFLETDFPNVLNITECETIMHALLEYWKNHTDNMVLLRLPSNDVIDTINQDYHNHFNVLKTSLLDVQQNHPHDKFLNSSIQTIKDGQEVFSQTYHVQQPIHLSQGPQHNASQVVLSNGSMNITVYRSSNRIKPEHHVDENSDMYLLSDTQNIMNDMLSHVHSYTMHIKMFFNKDNGTNYECDHYLQFSPYYDDYYEMYLLCEIKGKVQPIVRQYVQLPDKYDGIHYPLREHRLMQILAPKVPTMDFDNAKTITERHAHDHWKKFWEACPVLFQEYSKYNYGFASIYIHDEQGYTARCSVLLRYTCPSKPNRIRIVQDVMKKKEQTQPKFIPDNTLTQYQTYIKQKGPERKLIDKDLEVLHTVNEHVYIARITESQDLDIPSLFQLTKGIHVMQGFTDEHVRNLVIHEGVDTAFDQVNQDAVNRITKYTARHKEHLNENEIPHIDVQDFHAVSPKEFFKWKRFVAFFQAKRIEIENEVVKTVHKNNPHIPLFYDIRKHIALTTYTHPGLTKQDLIDSQLCNKGVFRAYLRRFREAQELWTKSWQNALPLLKTSYPDPKMFTYIPIPAKQAPYDLIYWYRDFMLDDAYKLPYDTFLSQLQPHIAREIAACNLVYHKFKDMHFFAKDMTNMIKLTSNLIHCLIHSNPYISYALFNFITSKLYDMCKHLKENGELEERIKYSDDMSDFLEDFMGQVSYENSHEKLASYVHPHMEYSHYVIFCNVYIIKRWEWSTLFIVDRNQKYTFLPFIHGATYGQDITPPRHSFPHNKKTGQTANIYGLQNGQPDDTRFKIIKEATKESPPEIAWKPLHIPPPENHAHYTPPFQWASSGHEYQPPKVNPNHQYNKKTSQNNNKKQTRPNTNWDDIPIHSKQEKKKNNPNKHKKKGKYDGIAPKPDDFGFMSCPVVIPKNPRKDRLLNLAISKKNLQHLRDYCIQKRYPGIHKFIQNAQKVIQRVKEMND